MPEVSLIFEKPTQARNHTDGDVGSPLARMAGPVQLSDKSVQRINIALPNSGYHNLHTVNPASASSDNRDSYTAWKEQIYSKENNYGSATRVSPSCKNVYSYASRFNAQDAIARKQQEVGDKICDTRNSLVNTRPNDRTREKNMKLQRSDTENSHGHKCETRLLSSDDRQLPSRDTVRRATCATDSATRMPDNTFADASKQNERLQVPCTPRPFQQAFHASSYSSRDIDSNETVKTLLQLVNNQSEQIKTLQLQVDRLARLQEETFGKKSTCACWSPRANQMFGYSAINCYDATNTRAQSHNQDTRQNAGQIPPATENKNSASLDRDKDGGKLALLEQQSKKAYMEQKVSIGVMTSFELTVQNSPFLTDSEMYKEKQAPARESNDIDGRNAINAHDTSESVKRYKNAFTRKPGTAQLENIVEDTESYLSSSHQQSSNFNASSSARESGRHTPKQSEDARNTTDISESPRMYRRPVTDPNREKMHERESYTRESDNADGRALQGTRVTCNAPGSTENAKRNEAFVVDDAHDYIATERNDERRPRAERHISRNVHSPWTNYHQSRRNEEPPSASDREARNVGDSVVLSGGDLKIYERPPSPEPSIHVEMQEYTSDDESDKVKRTSRIGWTFYNNVLGQVNEILQNSSVIEDREQHRETEAARRVEREDDAEARTALSTVKAATLEELRKLGISITDNEHRESSGNDKTCVPPFLLASKRWTCNRIAINVLLSLCFQGWTWIRLITLAWTARRT